jgi:hypothetical protein
MKKEQPIKKKSAVKILLGMKLVLLTILLVLAAQIGTAEERKGIITKTEIEGNRYYIHLDTDGNRITDTYLTFPHPRNSSLTSNLQTFVKIGMNVIFDDEGIITYASGNREASGDNTISIDGSNMIDLFPNEAARFKYAAAARQRAQTQATQSPPTPVAQETAEERRIRELEEELRRLREGR